MHLRHCPAAYAMLSPGKVTGGRVMRRRSPSDPSRLRVRIAGVMGLTVLGAVVVGLSFVISGSLHQHTVAADTLGVAIQDDSFSPSSFVPNPITVHQGDTVTWTN